MKGASNLVYIPTRNRRKEEGVLKCPLFQEVLTRMKPKVTSIAINLEIKER